jgi:MinD superfamily P-loop ATPase
MIITIASGKGGTGKTTVATNLAASLPDGVQLLDCDVEEPNAHIFLKPEIDEREKAFTMIPDVDLSLCTYCGKCDAICRFSAISQFGEALLTFPEMCHSCEGCVMVCPENAINKGQRELGEVISGNAYGVRLTYGRLRVGEAMSPPLIEKVKDHAEGSAVTIIDAPPGTSCPVIAALRGSDFVVLVTEPTPFGLNDLKLAVEAVRVLKLPFGIIINRCDAGNHETEAYATRENIPVLMKIPDKREIAVSYSKGELLVHAFPEMKKEFKTLYSDIQKRAH